ncbi:hypothetical protein ACCO45_010311 [Purpureocillium lilacinum]|uniref:Uncharacterized protein n=1 Tax=Purpureocillium lilacinum TaxID=33203 RepID=A0ACC4DF75_PURLI
MYSSNLASWLEGNRFALRITQRHDASVFQQLFIVFVYVLVQLVVVYARNVGDAQLNPFVDASPDDALFQLVQRWRDHAANYVFFALAHSNPDP